MTAIIGAFILGAVAGTIGGALITATAARRYRTLYRQKTREFNVLLDLCVARSDEPIADRLHLELWAREMEGQW